VTDRKFIEYRRTQSAQCNLIKTDTTERLIASLEAEPQGYRHFITLLFANS